MTIPIEPAIRRRLISKKMAEYAALRDASPGYMALSADGTSIVVYGIPSDVKATTVRCR